MAPQAVYIHIPFCTHKCHYCDFTAYVAKGQPVDDYIQALEREMLQTVQECPPGAIRSIFIGGGTPTVLTPEQLERLFSSIRRYFPLWEDEMEFTVEANPETTDRQRLSVMKKGGVNRLSFGAQTFREDLLTKIGRVHSAVDIRRSMELARDVGFKNLSLDLMFGLPEQRLADMEEALKQALELKPSHFSVYSLKVEEGTLFHHKLLQGKLPLPSEDEEFKMYQLTRKRLEEAGYYQYEVSNFSKRGLESKHNSIYWMNESYYGLGAGAHGYMKGVRHSNVKGVGEYIRKTQVGRPIAESYRESREERVENELILGLRLLDGIDPERFYRRFGQSLDHVFGPVVKGLKEQGLLTCNHGRLMLTEKGLLFGNDVFASFLGEATL